MSQAIYKLVTQTDTRYEMMTGERAQRKNYKREESKLSTRWLPVELEDVPNDAQIRDVSGKMLNAGELKDADYRDPTTFGEKLQLIIENPKLANDPAAIQAELRRRQEHTPPPPSQPTANPSPVDGEALAKAEAVQPLPAAQTPARVVPAAVAEPPKPDWYKGEPATMEDEDLLAVWMEYETDPRKDADYPQAEFLYREDVRAEYIERCKMGSQQREAELEKRKADVAEAKENGSADLPGDEGENLTSASQISHDDYYGVNQPESLRTYQLVGTPRVVQMTASEAKLLNGTIDGEWVYAPELKQFAKPRKPNGELKKRQKWRDISGTNLLMLCGSEGLSRNVAREVVKRLTGLEAADSTANAKMSEGRQDNADLPELNREGWAEFYHVVGEVKKTLGENGHKPIEPTVERVQREIYSDDIPLKSLDVTPDELTDVDAELTKRCKAVETILSRYRLQISQLLDRMTVEMQMALTD